MGVVIDAVSRFNERRRKAIEMRSKKDMAKFMDPQDKLKAALQKDTEKKDK